MKNLKMLVTATAAVGALWIGTAYGADTSPKSISEQAQVKVYEILDKDVTTVKFAPGSATLTDAEKTSLHAFVDKVKDEQGIDKIIVAAWSDKDYPAAKDEKLAKADRDLADKREDVIKKTLKDAGAKNVDTYSMAEHPGWLARVFNTTQAKLKGEGRVKDTDDRVIADLGRQLRSKGGPSTAVVIVKHKEELSAH